MLSSLLKKILLFLFTIFFTFLIWTVGRDRVHYENHGCLEGKQCFNYNKDFVGHIDCCYKEIVNGTTGEIKIKGPYTFCKPVEQVLQFPSVVSKDRCNFDERIADNFRLVINHFRRERKNWFFNNK